MDAPDHVRRVLDSLHYDFKTFALDHFVQHLEIQRRRDIIRVPYDFKPGLTGLWIPAETADYIFYARSTHPVHQVHIILHEIAHMLLHHPCQRIDQILPSSVIRSLQLSDEVLARSALTAGSNQVEQEAEGFVYLVQQQLVDARRLSQLTNGQSSIDGLKHFTDSLGLLGNS